jgi:hypothetical protein
MAAYGYDFHQTAIAKIEAAQRPLRVRELADFAALYGVGVQELVYAPARTLPEIDQEIEAVAAQLREAQAAALVAVQDVEAARAAARDAETANQSALAKVAVLTGRLDALVTDRDKLRCRDAGSDSGSEKADSGDGQISNAPSWWQSYSDILPSWFEPYIRLEAGADEIRIFEAGRIPDLLQTDSYSRAVNSRMHRYNLPEDVDRRVQLRAARSERLLEPSNAPRLQVVLDEAALLRQVGSKDVMRDQLRYLIEAVGRPNSEIKVLPLAAATVPTQESFRILHFSEPDWRDVVYLERLESAHYLNQGEEVDSYMLAMRQLASRALSADESVLFLGRILAAQSP